MTATISSPPTRPVGVDSLAEERREVFESVLAALARDSPDADQLAAGGRLLRHLSSTVVWPRR